MRCTLLGTGDALGVPVPLCDCAFCAASDPRRRPGLLVEAAGTTLLIDAPPDVTPALREASVTDLDAVFLTHGHYDHAAGVSELNHTRYERHLLNGDDLGHDHPVADPFETYVPRSVLQKYATERPGLVDRVGMAVVSPGDPVSVGALSVTAFEVEHGEPLFPTLGYVVRGPRSEGPRGDADPDEAVVGYAPDLNAAPDPGSVPADGLDLLFVEGSVLGAELHAEAAALRAGLDRLDADRRVATNVSEHMLRLHTGAVEERGREHGYEVWADGDAATL
ncbi:MBL fold metallo-hydrolase [Halobaculum magnesiiphilum]|uniref:MBL fold metallo-hydrolase n=1 Tax=Halobaculum magnesiiphilum TaxID=1017351 RepID=A0A8T8W9G9_9EURY|nr:MBL fold metallo-hydrolase [Halobaculum magnesiiphilum]QZP36470.1 MBL fold metallo-hydrolase [Halobaculum magnesiiphilum]